MAINDDVRKKDSEILARRALQVQRGGARAAVLGVNDGLVSTLSLVLAVAGAGAGQSAVQLAGFGGLIAGAISMAAGEWISVQSQVDLFKGVLGDLRKMVRNDKDLLAAQLKENFMNNGMQEKTSAAAAKELSADESHLQEVYASRVMGMNADELGSPWVAAGSSFVLFSIGSLVALWPWFVMSGTAAVVGSIIATGIGGLATGAYVAKSSGNNVMKGALRQFLIVVFAAAVTYGVGYLFGSSVG